LLGGSSLFFGVRGLEGVDRWIGGEYARGRSGCELLDGWKVERGWERVRCQLLGRLRGGGNRKREKRKRAVLSLQGRREEQEERRREEKIRAQAIYPEHKQERKS